ncbi:hypothetical protein ACJ4V0_20225, partial [Phreatobacter sp. HK31-P]
MTLRNPILIVEDQPILLMDLESGLEEGGYAVLSARNAEEAMAILATDVKSLPIATPISRPKQAPIEGADASGRPGVAGQGFAAGAAAFP